MAHSIPPKLETTSPERVRRTEIIRPADDRKLFPQREAQQRLRQKERRWAPLAYAVFLVAILSIFLLAYTTYAFSKYRGEILPGVYVDRTPVGGLTATQAKTLIANRLVVKYNNPVTLQYNALRWQPKAQQLGLSYDIAGTVTAAMDVGRKGPFVAQLIDRAPLHPPHRIQLRYTLSEQQVLQYIQQQIVRGPQRLSAPSQNAFLYIDNSNHVQINHSRSGRQLNLTQAVQAVRSSLNSLSVETRTLAVIHTQPQITDVVARRVRDRVEAFLSSPPVITVGKRVFVTSRYSFARMFHFHDAVGPHRAAIQLNVDQTAVQAFVQYLASQVDRQAENAKLSFAGTSVQIISPRLLGRTLDQQAATQRLLPIVTGLRPHARLRLPVLVTQPPVDASNPASLGITTLLATGTTSFAGSDTARLDDITGIAKTLDQQLFNPGQDISFNTLMASTAWSDEVYRDQEIKQNGQLVPGSGGAMQQVATTFLRALYNAGLHLSERHGHTYRLPWYEPPVGYDAIVSPAKSFDLRFLNNTGGHLLIETSVQPLRQQLTIYVYGAKVGWKVAVDSTAQITKVIPHGPKIVQQDPALAPGEQHQTAFAHDGATTILHRTILKPNGDLTVDKIPTTYQPWQAVVEEGSVAPTPRATPQATPKAGASATATGTTTVTTATPTASPTVSPSPSATFSH